MYKQLKNAKERSDQRRRYRRNVRQYFAMYGWRGGAVPSPGEGWPFEVSTTPVNKHEVRVTVDLPRGKQVSRVLSYDDLTSVVELGEEAVLECTGLPVSAGRGEVWYYEMLEPAHHLHWLVETTGLAAGPVLVSTTQEGDTLAFTVFEGDNPENRYDYHVEWRLLDGPDLTNWSSLEYFQEKILA